MINNRRWCADRAECIHFYVGACWYEVDSNSIGAECIKTENLPCVKPMLQPACVRQEMQYSLGDFVTIRKTPFWIFKIDKIYYKGEDVCGTPRPATLYKVSNTSNHMHEGIYIGSSLCEAEELSEPINMELFKRSAYKPSG